MIKTDFKPRKPRNPIFSEKKRLPFVPVMLIFTALVLIFWGINSQTTTDEKPVSNDIDIADTNSIETASPEEQTTRSYSIDLNLGADSDESTPQQSQPIRKTLKQSTDISSKSPAKQLSPQKPERKWVQTKIKRGDSTAKVFSRHGLSARELFEIMQLGKDTAILKKVQAGHLFEYSLAENGNLYGIRYHIDKLNTLVVTKAGNNWQAETQTKAVEIRQANASGVIESNLFLAGKKAGLTDSMVMELAGIFGWDIDFILDIRQDDSFTLVYEEKYVDGEKFGNGAILAAEFVNQSKSYKAVRYTDSKGNAEYYTPDGLSMRKAFLRAPVDFKYISSNFNPKRFHPILRRVKAHRGVDYRAPTGTPVKAAGDGKVIASAYNKYNGHYVFIQHGQKYVTKYLHFSKRAVRKGQRVKQGELIGYVGSTGQSQAPHLHYEFLVNGVHRNPRTVDLPDAEPVARAERKRFFASTAGILNQLNTISSQNQINLATAD